MIHDILSLMIHDILSLIINDILSLMINDILNRQERNPRIHHLSSIISLIYLTCRAVSRYFDSVSSTTRQIIHITEKKNKTLGLTLYLLRVQSCFGLICFVLFRFILFYFGFAVRLIVVVVVGVYLIIYYFLNAQYALFLKKKNFIYPTPYL